MEKKQFITPNSCGQGKDPDHAAHPLHATVTAFGYVYSHSTNVGTLDGQGWHVLHTYFFPNTEHTVTLREADRGTYREPITLWSTSVSPASSRDWDGRGEPELTAHLKSKRRRYDLR